MQYDTKLTCRMWDILFPCVPKEGVIMKAHTEAKDAEDCSSDKVCGPKVCAKHQE